MITLSPPHRVPRRRKDCPPRIRRLRDPDLAREGRNKPDLVEAMGVRLVLDEATFGTSFKRVKVRIESCICY